MGRRLVRWPVLAPMWHDHRIVRPDVSLSPRKPSTPTRESGRTITGLLILLSGELLSFGESLNLGRNLAGPVPTHCVDFNLSPLTRSARIPAYLHSTPNGAAMVTVSRSATDGVTLALVYLAPPL
jgi:hypothetical protein